MKTIILGNWTSIDPKRNRFRAYQLHLTEDLWGETCLVKEWGRIGRRPRQRFYWPASNEELARLLQQAIFRRAKRGYTPSWHSPLSPTPLLSPTVSHNNYALSNT